MSVLKLFSLTSTINNVLIKISFSCGTVIHLKSTVLTHINSTDFYRHGEDISGKEVLVLHSSHT